MKNSLETRLGIFFALALVVAVVILEMIGAAEFFTRGYQIDASFKTVQELKKGDLVKQAGVEIGRVDDIDLVNGRAKVTMKINSRYEIKTDSKAIIKFTGLMGQNFVSVENGSPTAPALGPGGSLETLEQPDLSAIMMKLDNVGTKVERLTESFSTENFSSLLGPLTDFFAQSKADLTNIIKNVRLVSDNIAQGKGTVGKLINDPEFYSAAYGAVTNIQSASDDLKGLIANAGGMMTQARGLVDDINAGQGTLGKFVRDDSLFIEATNAMTNLRQILEKMNRGQGSVGKLVNDESLYRNAKLGLQKLEKATEGLEDQGALSVIGIVAGNLF